MTQVNLVKEAKSKGIKYFLLSFVDLFGVLRAKMVPAAAIEYMCKNGAGFAGFAAWLDMTPAHPDMLGMPDKASFIQLPWKKEVAWLACDLWMDGKAVIDSPRVTLKKQAAEFHKKGYYPKSGVECEFFLLDADGQALADKADTQSKPCYDQVALMRQYDIISEICDAMLELGWEPYQNDHEDGNGQFEMNWGFTDVLTTADRHTFFKYMVRSIAEKHGLRATFMPKPFTNLTGNGCHAHISVWDESGKENLFLNEKDQRNLGLSDLAYNFLGGVLNHAVSLCAIFNPTVNSYKRINRTNTTSGASWSPSTVTYTGNNRTHMVRVPDAGRFELRLMDGAANPYLLQAGVLAAGMDGITNKTNPGEPLHINMFTDAHKVKKAKRLPESLADALALLNKSTVLRKQLGDEIVNAYVKLKQQQWAEYNADVSNWERQNTLDC